MIISIDRCDLLFILLYTMIISKDIVKQMHIKQSILKLQFENIFLCFVLVFFGLFSPLKIGLGAILLCRLKTMKRVNK